MRYTLIAILVTIILHACVPAQLQVRRMGGKITKVDRLPRFGEDMTAIEWTLDDRTKRYEYIKYDENDSAHILGTYDIFLVGK